MKPQTKIAIAQLLAAAGSALTAFAAEILDSTPAIEAAPETSVETEKPKRGRKSTVAEPAPVAPVEPEPAPAPAEEVKVEVVEEPAPANTEEGESDEAKQARYKENQKLIEPLVKVQLKGADVKKVIAKYSTGGMIDLPLKHQKAFEADLEALSM